MGPVHATDAREVILGERLQWVVDFGRYELISLKKILFSSEAERDDTDC